jgi:hypothetical protein
MTGKLTFWILQKSDPVVFLFLSLKVDPFITMVYLRNGAFNGMNICSVAGYYREPSFQ